MRKLFISDVTLREAARHTETSLSFKEKIEIAKLLDRLKASAVELPAIVNENVDTVLIKTVAISVKNSVIAVPVPLEISGVEKTWAALKEAKKPRLQVAVPLSAVQMEYICHKKPNKVVELISQLVTCAVKLCPDVEFIAEDATRSETRILTSAIDAAIGSGAKKITLCDTAGEMLPDEFGSFLQKLYSDIPELAQLSVGVSCSDAIQLGVACAMSAVATGADDIKVVSSEANLPSFESFAQIIRLRGESLGYTCDIRFTELNRAAKQIKSITEAKKSNTSPFESGVSDIAGNDIVLSLSDDVSAVSKAVTRLGYELSGDDLAKVFDEVRRIAEKKKSVSGKELDAIVASVALQVPPTYRVQSYVINSGNIISATAHIKLEKQGETIEGISIGDGPIDAAFLAIEKITGHHYELDDFQIQAVTEGREAMGSALVKLRNNGRLYSGKGISTDVIGASIRAYVNALNKIVFEED